MVKLLLDHRAVNVVSIDTLEIVKNGNIVLGRLTPLLLAADRANFETVELLVEAGATVTARDVRGLTPLALSIATGHADARIVRLLLLKGADPALKSTNGETALDWARKYRDPEVQRALGLSPEKMTVEQAGRAASRGVPAALERSVALLQGSAAKFLETGGCLACHAQH